MSNPKNVNCRIKKFVSQISILFVLLGLFSLLVYCSFLIGSAIKEESEKPERQPYGSSWKEATKEHRLVTVKGNDYFVIQKSKDNGFEVVFGYKEKLKYLKYKTMPLNLVDVTIDNNVQFPTAKWKTWGLPKESSDFYISKIGGISGYLIKHVSGVEIKCNENQWPKLLQ